MFLSPARIIAVHSLSLDARFVRVLTIICNTIVRACACDHLLRSLAKDEAVLGRVPPDQWRRRHLGQAASAAGVLKNHLPFPFTPAGALAAVQRGPATPASACATPLDAAPAATFIPRRTVRQAPSSASAQHQDAQPAAARPGLPGLRSARLVMLCEDKLVFEPAGLLMM